MFSSLWFCICLQRIKINLLNSKCQWRSQGDGLGGLQTSPLLCKSVHLIVHFSEGKEREPPPSTQTFHRTLPPRNIFLDRPAICALLFACWVQRSCVSPSGMLLSTCLIQTYPCFSRSSRALYSCVTFQCELHGISGILHLLRCKNVLKHIAGDMVTNYSFSHPL